MMIYSNLRYLQISPAITLLTTELIRVFIRPIYGQAKFGIVSTILGWLPNFLGSLGYMLLCNLTIAMLVNTSGKNLSKKNLITLLLGFTVFGLIGFTVHELNQDGKRLFYDINDVYASIAGILVGTIFYSLTLLKSSNPAT